jgi:hypothetical protein
MLSAQFVNRYFLTLLLVLLIFIISFITLSPSAHATVLFTADTSGSVIVQSRRTLRDSERHSWQVVAFKPIHADGREGEVYLRLVGFPGTVEVDHHQPIKLTDSNGHSLLIANISDQISQNPPQPHVAQYNLQAALVNLPSEYRLRVDLPTVQLDASELTSSQLTLQISPAQIEEWQTVANTHASDLIHACDRFPNEALQNPAFPDWLKCS